MSKHLIQILMVLAIVSIICCSDSSTPTSTNNPPPAQSFGELVINISGLITNQIANLSISGPQDTTFDCTGHSALDSMKVGVYTITTNYIIDINGDTLFSPITNQSILVEKDKTATIDLPYQGAYYGSLNVYFSGLPDGVNGFVKLVKSDNTFIQNITDSIQIDSLFVGNYLLVCSNVLAANDREFIPLVDTIFATITNGNVTSYDIAYQSGFYFTAFGTINQGAVSSSVAASLDGNAFNDSNGDHDQGTSSGFISNGCQLIATDLEAGYTAYSNSSTSGGSAGITQTYEVVRGATNTVTLTTTAQVDAPTPGSSTYGTIHSEVNSGQYPLVLQIENPDRDSVEVIISWSGGVTNSVSGTDISRVGSQSQGTFYIHTSGCFSSLFTTSVAPSFSLYGNGLHTNESGPVSGEISYKFTSQFYLIGYGFTTRTFAHSYQQNTGDTNTDGSGNGIADLSVTITATIRRY